MKNVIGLLIVFSFVSNGAGAATKLNCRSNGGGYIVSSLAVEELDNGELSFAFARFSPVPEIVPQAGFKIGNDIATNVRIVVPKKNCHERKSELSGIPVLGCSSEISNLKADVVLLDKSQKTIKIQDNSLIEVFFVRTERVYGFSRESVVQANFNLDHSPELNQLGFDLSSCR